MSKVETKYIRKRESIHRADTGAEFLRFDSISKAKHWSLTEQQRHGGRGNGYVSVDRSADPKPKRLSKRQDAADKFLTEALRKEQAARVAQEQDRKTGTLGLKA